MAISCSHHVNGNSGSGGNSEELLGTTCHGPFLQPWISHACFWSTSVLKSFRGDVTSTGSKSTAAMSFNSTFFGNTC